MISRLEIDKIKRYFKETPVRFIGLALMVLTFLVAVVVPPLAFDLSEDIPLVFCWSILGFLVFIAGPLFILERRRESSES